MGGCSVRPREEVDRSLAVLALLGPLRGSEGVEPAVRAVEGVMAAVLEVGSVCVVAPEVEEKIGLPLPLLDTRTIRSLSGEKKLVTRPGWLVPSGVLGPDGPHNV